MGSGAGTLGGNKRPYLFERSGLHVSEASLSAHELAGAPIIPGAAERRRSDWAAS